MNETEPAELTPAYYLRQERERLGLNQQQLAGLLSISMQKMRALEALPGNPLEKLKVRDFATLARHGMDVNLILTGGRVIPLDKRYLPS